MPHQCLKCGTLFPEGNTTILRGCPECRGTRFFFTHDPIPEVDRERLLKKAERELPALLQEVLIDSIRAPPSAPATLGPPRPAAAPDPTRPEGVLLPGNRLLIKLPRQMRGRVQRALVQWDYEVAPTEAQVPPAFQDPGPGPVPAPPLPWPPPSPDGPPEPEPGERPHPPTQDAGREPSRYPEGQRPETVRIQQPGEYEIEVQRLLEASPIVIQRDGMYLLHLPSIFESARKPPDSE